MLLCFPDLRSPAMISRMKSRPAPFVSLAAMIRDSRPRSCTATRRLFAKFACVRQGFAAFRACGRGPRMTEPVVTRFAPSPTGFLHIGGARTALFNWLYARGRGGKMLLRIEDTDRERSTEAAIDAILDGLNWLGITWDGDEVHQYSRVARHREVAEQLLAS